MARLRSSRVEEASEATTRAVELNPELGFAKALLAECDLRLGRPCDALRHAEGVVLDDPAERETLERVRQRARAGCDASR